MWIFGKHRHISSNSLSEYVSGRAAGAEKARIDRALAECALCREEMESLQSTRSMLRSMPDLALPRSFVMAAAPTPTTAVSSPPAPSFIRGIPAWAYAGAASLAVAAVALIVIFQSISPGLPGESELSPVAERAVAVAPAMAETEAMPDSAPQPAVEPASIPEPQSETHSQPAMGDASAASESLSEMSQSETVRELEKEVIAEAEVVVESLKESYDLSESAAAVQPEAAAVEATPRPEAMAALPESAMVAASPAVAASDEGESTSLEKTVVRESGKEAAAVRGVDSTATPLPAAAAAVQPESSAATTSTPAETAALPELAVAGQVTPAAANDMPMATATLTRPAEVGQGARPATPAPPNPEPPADSTPSPSAGSTIHPTEGASALDQRTRPEPTLAATLVPTPLPAAATSAPIATADSTRGAEMTAPTDDSPRPTRAEPALPATRPGLPEPEVENPTTAFPTVPGAAPAQSPSGAAQSRSRAAVLEEPGARPGESRPESRPVVPERITPRQERAPERGPGMTFILIGSSILILAIVAAAAGAISRRRRAGNTADTRNF